MLYDVKSLDVCKMKKADPPPTPGYEPCNAKVRNSRKDKPISRDLLEYSGSIFHFSFCGQKKYIGPVD